MHKALDLLNTENVEPVIRRSALTQINLMLEDFSLHEEFIVRHGVELVVDIMRISLDGRNFKDYPDSIVPAISILKCICIHNSGVRQDLSNKLNVYCYLLRGREFKGGGSDGDVDVTSRYRFISLQHR